MDQRFIVLLVVGAIGLGLLVILIVGLSRVDETGDRQEAPPLRSTTATAPAEMVSRA